MNENDTIRWLTERVREQAADAPSIDPVDIHVRSGLTFIFRDPQKRGVAADHQACIKDGLDKGWLLGSFVVEWGFDVLPGKIKEFHRWLLNHEPDIVQSQPEGVKYRGTYAVFSTSEKGSGGYRTVWVFDSFQGMQNMGQMLAKEDSPFSQLVADLVAFFDRDHAAGTSQQIYQPAQGTINLAALGQ